MTRRYRPVTHAALEVCGLRLHLCRIAYAAAILTDEEAAVTCASCKVRLAELRGEISHKTGRRPRVARVRPTVEELEARLELERQRAAEERQAELFPALRLVKGGQ